MMGLKVRNEDDGAEGERMEMMGLKVRNEDDGAEGEE